MAESMFFAPPIGLLRCACCGEDQKVDPFKHEQDFCTGDCWYTGSEGEIIFNTMHTTSWYGWEEDRRGK